MRAGRRIPELDALRGIAAAVVLTFHWLAVMPAWNADTRHDGGAYLLLNAVKYTPLHVFAAGPEAVLLFFVLSGFVLALPFVEGRAGGYLPFLVRRAFRIYPAAWLMAAVSALALLRVGAGAVVSGPSMVDAGWL